MPTNPKSTNPVVFNRVLFNKLLNSLSSEHVVILYGPRQVGKTFLMKQIKQYLKAQGVKTTYVSAELLPTYKILSQPDLSKLKAYFGDTEVIFIDEAQKIPNIGEVLKVLVDYTDYKVLISGSSSLFLSNLTEESLAGRKRTFTLYPLTFEEIAGSLGRTTAYANLNTNLIIGGYPRVNLMFLQGASLNDIQIYLTELVNSTLYKDLLSLAPIKHPQKIFDLLELLYHNLAGEVSLNKLANALNIDVKTVDKYLDMLTKVFLITPLRPLFNNTQKEVKRSKKYYFVDNGVANVFYGSFEPHLPAEQMGRLWENYVFTQLRALSEYNDLLLRFYFWRQKTNGKVKEIDFVLKKGDKMFAIETKYNPQEAKKYANPPRLFTRLYPQAQYAVITPENFVQVLQQVKDHFA